MRYITYPKLPSIPSDIELEVIEVAKKINFQENEFNLTTEESIMEKIQVHAPVNMIEILGVRFSDAHKYFNVSISKFAFVNAPHNLVKWVEENINMNIRSINVQAMSGGTDIVPHVDEIRTGALNYLLSTGGSKVETRFYESLRPDLKAVSQTAIPYDKVKLIESAELPLRVWHILSTKDIHSVNGLTPNDVRISVSISL
jgi:hypothetical protein